MERRQRRRQRRARGSTRIEEGRGKGRRKMSKSVGESRTLLDKGAGHFVTLCHWNFSFPSLLALFKYPTSSTYQGKFPEHLHCVSEGKKRMGRYKCVYMGVYVRECPPVCPSTPPSPWDRACEPPLSHLGVPACLASKRVGGRFLPSAYGPGRTGVPHRHNHLVLVLVFSLS